MIIDLHFLIAIALAQSIADSRNGPNGNVSTNDGSLQVRVLACEAAQGTLVSDYTNCFAQFPLFANSTDQADSLTYNFVSCICASTWAAGSIQQLHSSIPLCPAIPGVSKGGQISVASDCAPGSPLDQQRKIVTTFGLRTIIGKNYYVPLAGLPIGVLSSAAITASISLLPIIIPFLY